MLKMMMVSVPDDVRAEAVASLNKVIASVPDDVRAEAGAFYQKLMGTDMESGSILAAMSEARATVGNTTAEDWSTADVQNAVDIAKQVAGWFKGD